jgi:hypothetical protein
MTADDPYVSQIRTALRGAIAADLTGTVQTRRPPRRRARRRIATALVAAALVVPAGALAIEALSPDQEVAAGLPAGGVVFAGTEPTCTTLREGIEYECALGKAPREETYEPGIIWTPPDTPRAQAGHWRGVVEVTVDASGHVNGGCRAEDPEGTSWRCFLGEESVRQGLVGQAFLGKAAGPLRG